MWECGEREVDTSQALWGCQVSGYHGGRAHNGDTVIIIREKNLEACLCNLIEERMIKCSLKHRAGPSKLHSCWSKSCFGSHSLCTLWAGGTLPTMHITQSSVIIFNQNGINNFLSDGDRHARALVKIVAGSLRLFTPFSSNQNLHLAHLSWRHLASLALPQFRNLQNCKIASQDELNCTQLFCNIVLVWWSLCNTWVNQ